jgi:hypothetical protein
VLPFVTTFQLKPGVMSLVVIAFAGAARDGASSVGGTGVNVWVGVEVGSGALISVIVAVEV